MQKFEKGFFPLREVEDREIEGIKVSLNLPDYVDSDKIGVNLRGIYRLCRMGGIGAIRIIGSMDGDISTYAPDIVGMNSDGAAEAGKRGLKRKAPLFHGEPRLVSQKLPSECSWLDTTINVNLREIKCRILDKKNKKLREPGNWTDDLDKALRTGISSEGTRHLIKDVTENQKGRMLGIAIFFASWDYVDIQLSHASPKIIFPAFIAQLTTLGAAAKVLDRFDYRKHNGARKFSLFYGPHFDRAILLKIMSKTNRLIKELKTTEINAQPTSTK
jgi:hypothetical protein